MTRRDMLKLCGGMIALALLVPRKAKLRPLVVGSGETLRLESGKHYPWIELRGGTVYAWAASATVGRLDIIRGTVCHASMLKFQASGSPGTKTNTCLTG